MALLGPLVCLLQHSGGDAGVIAKRVCSSWVLGTLLMVHSEQMSQAVSAPVMPSSAL